MYHPLPAFSHSLGMGSQTRCKGQTLLCGSDRGDFLLFCSWTQSESSRKRRWDTPHVLCATSLQLCLCSPGGAGSSLGEHRALGALSVTAEESRWWVRWGRTDGLRRVFLHQAGQIISSLHLPHASCTNYCGKLLTFTFLMYSSFFFCAQHETFILLQHIATTLCSTWIPSTWRARVKSLDINDHLVFALSSLLSIYGFALQVHLRWEEREEVGDIHWLGCAAAGI